VRGFRPLIHPASPSSGRLQDFSSREIERRALRREMPNLMEFHLAPEPNGARKMPATSRCAESHRLGILGK